MTSESDERCRQCGATGLTAERLRWATPVCFKCVRKTAGELADEVATLRAKLTEAERGRDEAVKLKEDFKGVAERTVEETRAVAAERDAATARAAEAERLLEDVVATCGAANHGMQCTCALCQRFGAACDAARSHLQSLKAKEPTDGE